MKKELFKGALIQFTAVDPDDAEIIAGWEENAETLRNYSTEFAIPRPVSEIKEWIESLKDDEDICFAIRPRQKRSCVGLLIFSDIEWNNRVAELSIVIGDPASRGKGFGKEAIAMAQTYAFNEINLHRLQITVISYNTRAITLYEKAGFIKEGVYREFLQRDGKRHDMYLYSMLQPEWEARNPR